MCVEALLQASHGHAAASGRKPLNLSVVRPMGCRTLCIELVPTIRSTAAPQLFPPRLVHQGLDAQQINVEPPYRLLHIITSASDDACKGSSGSLQTATPEHWLTISSA